MKLLTLNTHSWLEEQPYDKLDTLVETILSNQFDVIAFQEVNQSIAESVIDVSDQFAYQAADPTIQIKRNNFAFLVQQKLEQAGLRYAWTWLPAHIGYDIYDEGLAFLSLHPIQEIKTFYASKSKAYENYKTRPVLGVQIEDSWYFNLHLGWWTDKDDSFKEQWAVCTAVFQTLSGPIYLMGDFNNPAQATNEGYELVTKEWFDTFHLAIKRDKGHTVEKNIDGWAENNDKLRIDFIFTNHPIGVDTSKVFFDGKNNPVISDHYGVSIQLTAAIEQTIV
ncbi:MAG: endonuclease/exonuclease/phosphatase family protein [Carnobacterium sp.]|uniref:endonuclease/exonuclease/phosphatase family protein n=1 Tax=unclassified Carnobacterium TaxID=257487 RepID=UPI001912BF39|nr:endonuclease/exonuclease/phosphatase family protein [Carnobacterium sp. CS13]QQP69844.1 endonuclease/exonuclease/phosphatase family protein [Carnobacterium sp. CS13]